jgi:heme/copper-type cytochrome/quinol oxidase subunit 3
MMVASIGVVLKSILWIFIISGVIQFIVKFTANYAVRKVNEEVKNSQRSENASHKTRNNPTSGHKTPDSEYVDFVEIKDQE